MNDEKLINTVKEFALKLAEEEIKNPNLTPKKKLVCLGMIETEKQNLVIEALYAGDVPEIKEEVDTIISLLMQLVEVEQVAIDKLNEAKKNNIIKFKED